ncbi:hypothetical protein NP493_114g04008 [Ridgeia piscesae]|uniref:Uncharacterized protein n=1 Tax=Ridgeia piscesae TaxID=27915 RepID=A0AAD9UGZ3_RIDPI|nr:hypothetical protein NP493_114g04008 [Ridgeia piscesae]
MLHGLLRGAAGPARQRHRRNQLQRSGGGRATDERLGPRHLQPHVRLQSDICLCNINAGGRIPLDNPQRHLVGVLPKQATTIPGGRSIKNRRQRYLVNARNKTNNNDTWWELALKQTTTSGRVRCQ